MNYRRRGLGKGMGMGYKNLAPLDSYVHRMSAMGIRHRQVLGFKRYIDEQQDNEIFVPKTVKKYVKSALKKEKYFDKHTLNAEGGVNLDSIDFSSLDLGMGMGDAPSFTPELPSIDMPSNADLSSAIADLPPLDTSVSSGLNVDMPSDKELALQVFGGGSDTPTVTEIDPAMQKESIWEKISQGVKKGVDWEKKNLPKQEAFLKKVGVGAVNIAGKIGSGIKKRYDAYKQAQVSQRMSPQPMPKVMNKQDYIPEKYVEKDYLKSMDDDELLDYARREQPSMLFKYNRYEQELVRREKNRQRFEKDFAKQSSQYARDFDNNFNMVGFAIPFATLSAKRKFKFNMIKGLEKTIKGE